MLVLVDICVAGVEGNVEGKFGDIMGQHLGVYFVIEDYLRLSFLHAVAPLGS